MDTASVQDYLGVPVLVQLRFPLAGIEVKDKGKLPYAEEPDKSQWIPAALMDNGSPSGTQLIQFAVLRAVEDGGNHSLIEMVWSSIPSAPAPGAMMGTTATIATLVALKDIVAITRVVNVPELSSLILPSR